jgi:hypothetical protein
VWGILVIVVCYMVEKEEQGVALLAWRGVAFFELEVKNEKSTIARQEQNKNEL